MADKIILKVPLTCYSFQGLVSCLCVLEHLKPANSWLNPDYLQGVVSVCLSEQGPGMDYKETTLYLQSSRDASLTLVK